MTKTPCRSKWKGTMTDRERFNNQMHYKPFDRCFNKECGYWAENYSLWEGFRENNISSWDDAYELFNFDRYAMISGPYWMCPPFECKVVSETKSTKIIVNSDGLIEEVLKDGSSFPHCIRSSVVTPADWQKCKAEHFSVYHPGRKIDVAKLKKAHPADRTYPLCMSVCSLIGGIRSMLTFEGLAYAIYDYPEMVEDMVETCCQLSEHYLDQVLGHVEVDAARCWEDICFKNGPIVSVDFFNKVVVPRYQRISKKLRDHGVDIFETDCDGDVRPLVPGFLEGGVNCLSPFEVMAAGHPADLFKEYGPELRIMGGFDKMKFYAGRDALKSYMESLVPLVARGGYIPHLDHLCPPDVRYADYLYYLDVKEEMFGMNV